MRLILVAASVIDDTLAGTALAGLLRGENLRKAAARRTGDGVVVPSALVVQVFLPGAEAPSATEPPAFSTAPATAYPAWFRTLMRHSCLFEDERLRTVKAVSWWGPTGGSTAPAANPPPQSLPHRFVTSVGGKQAKTWVDGWPADRNSAVMFDGQTITHGVFANRGVGVEQQELCTIDTDAASLRYSAANATWSVLSTDGATLARFDEGRVSLAVTWEAAVFQDEAERTRLAKPAAKAPTLNARLDVLLGDLRARGKMAYREHLLNRAHPRLRWKLADFLAAEYIGFPERPAYPVVTTVMNPCALLERAPVAYGIYNTLLALFQCGAVCKDPVLSDDAAGRDRSDM